ncbi:MULTISPECIES: pyrroloquinoline quinone-dependent dehydrogenase [Flavobacteriaceae]|uniref:pyrroloquinoline quinone-dependent dehydrogenase n=1 Tax=Flavobacteriaceae TaxID=49546 RepID=UPI001492940C|nr:MULTISPECIES: pyrroloquinoline quinone-dependent dehydrogenase [Allomuricauda]MDC6365784.1 pyrroloquinoline quinone-dependent dehydrogenase [Muricauda sp. AC10]
MSSKKLSPVVLFLILIVFAACESSEKESAKDYTTWSSYLGGPDRNHYSTLSQITKENVKNLKIAWSYSAPDSGQMQMNPIVVDTILYGVTAALRAVALHAATGRELWRFGDSIKQFTSTSRGVSYWSKGNDKRILYTSGANLFALNALTGKPVPTFGNNGKIDLRSGMPPSAQKKFVISNTPGTIYKDIIVMPIRLGEDIGSAPGNIMAFNVVTGAVEWVFHTIPHPGEEGYDTWENKHAYKSDIVGAANSWSGMSLDEETGIIYIPTGSASPDFYGGIRNGTNLFSNCLLALDAATGERIWHFQFVHHDLWDRDIPAPPNLITVERNGKKIKAVAQVTKQGYVYVFDRATGKPLFDIEEVPVPATTLEGEKTWPTQPIPVKPKPFARLSKNLTEEDISPYAENKDELKEILKTSDKREYAPPGLKQMLILPGLDGAAEWGGTGADPDEGIIYVNSNEMGWLIKMAENEDVTETIPLGEKVYSQYCVICHRKDKKGVAASGYPSLLNIKDSKTKEEVAQLVKTGKGMMTGFPNIPADEKEALLKFLFDEETELVTNTASDSYPLPYKFTGYARFLDSNGYPAISPPWGTMHAIDLNTGDFIWSITFGDTPELRKEGQPVTGSENYGGPIITENGLLFIAATKDGYFRAYDKKTGELLWKYKLPAAAFATPAMYEINGKQYIALACGGEKLNTPKGNQIIAFALAQ